MAGTLTGLGIRGASKRFGEVVALRGVDLEAVPGELLVVVGPSGCGKSTLLRCVAGLETLDEGSILIGDRDVTRVRPGARDVSMVFQSYALFPHLSVAGNIGFGLAVREEPKREVRKRVAEVSELVSVTHLLERRPYQLSGGERQRVALARALVRKPRAFLLDEPLSNLDAGARVEMRAEIRRLHRTVGVTTMHVTHDQVEALTLADRVAVMNDGRVCQVGRPDEVYQSPSSLFVARFLGTPSINVLAGELASSLGVPDGAVAAVRPEHVGLDGDRPARVELVEMAGSEAYVHLPGGLVATVSADSRPREGDEVRIGIRREHVLLFDVDSGERRGGR